MSEDKEKERFLTRWSRLKQQEECAPSHRAADLDAPPTDLPPVDALTIDSDFSGYFHPKLDENLRRAALRKLFGDPHFNVMDGLDVYIDDYSKSDPLPPELLAQLKHAQQILAWAREDTEKTAREAAAAAARPLALVDEQPFVGSDVPPVGEPWREMPNVEPQDPAVCSEERRHDARSQ